MKRLIPFVIIIVVLAVAFGAYFYMKEAAVPSPSTPVSTTTTDVAAQTARANAATNAATNAAPGAQPPHFRGSENASVIIEEFGDFECPPCGLFYSVLKGTEDEFGPRIKVIFREFPLTPNHVHALPAARAAEAAGLQGRFFEMHDLIYQNQKAWKDVFDVRPVFAVYAKQIGLDVERWQRDQTGEAVDQRIFLDGNRAHSLGVKGTPTVFLNGVEVPFEQLTPEGLRAAINQALSK